MQIPIYQVDAFTSKLFGGNPAAVCPLDEWLTSETLQAIASENNLSETAFYLKTGDRYHLRWFTPGLEVDLCGHATLATAHVLLNVLESDASQVVFDTRSGELKVKREGERLVMDFPSKPPTPADPPAGMLEALGGEPLEFFRGQYYMAVYQSEAEIRALAPDFNALSQMDDAVIVTAPGESEDVDFVSRFFAPSFGIDEDPVTGSAHCTLTPFWTERQCKWWFDARQISKRGGELHCELQEDRVTLAGQAVLYLTGTITI
jgi:PhzF family phenazine biosynthesis protein